MALIDLKNGRLRLPTETAGRPSVLSIERRASPELFAFPKIDVPEGEGAEVLVEGLVVEALSVRADLKDSGYQSLVQQRAEDHSPVSGHRSQHLKSIRQMDERPERERLVASGVPTTSAPSVSSTQSACPNFLEVAAIVEKALQEAGIRGLSCSELLERMPDGCMLSHLRDSLVALATLSLDSQTSLEDAAGLLAQRRYVYAPCLGWTLSGEMQRGRFAGEGTSEHKAASSPPPLADNSSIATTTGVDAGTPVTTEEVHPQGELLKRRKRS